MSDAMPRHEGPEQKGFNRVHPPSSVVGGMLVKAIMLDGANGSEE